MKTLLALLLLAFAASPATAQRRDTVWNRATLDSAALAPARPPAALRIANRTMTGVLGLAVLATAGGVAGYQMTRHTEGGDDPGLGGLLVGATLGGATGAALAAALPEHGARCSYRARATRGMVGAVATSALYLIAGANGAGKIVVTFPVGIPLAAAAAADC